MKESIPNLQAIVLAPVILSAALLLGITFNLCGYHLQLAAAQAQQEWDVKGKLARCQITTTTITNYPSETREMV
jgi:hypothetical protein